MSSGNIENKQIPQKYEERKKEERNLSQNKPNYEDLKSKDQKTQGKLNFITNNIY